MSRIDITTKREAPKTQRFAPVGLVFGLLGLTLFVYFVRKAGFGEVLSGISRLGWAFVIILAISGVRYVVRAIAWTKCVEKPYSLRFRDAFAARLMGDALGNIIPLISFALSEPSKAVFVKDRVPLIVGLSALAIENICYGLSVSFFVLAGTTTLLLSFSLPKPLHYASLVTLFVTIAIIPLAVLVINRRAKFLTGVIHFLERRGVARKALSRIEPKARTVEERICGFYARNRDTLLPLFILESLFHLAGICEIYTTLWFISPTVPSFRQAFVLESVNRIINMVFKFMPFRVGVDEGGTEQVAKVLGLVKSTGVALAIVRKSRDIFWSTIGVVLLLKRGFSIRKMNETSSESLSNAAG